ncbi:uncharacterized protein H6S33_007153 [Morchella sextelata]|uniref:uncharacterized protein n=1 Tax=Morchella sextelata TaxID=1174677 RepID=UPI001D038B42|nr:uncharacterized protein H6S33_007153 [Morchella sextelata]KAH0604122.1 hypothetical protein H6S33_007153 [Morchella sextelata]
MEPGCPFSKEAIEKEYHNSVPTRNLAIVTCMDAWIQESDAFGVAAGEAHVIRNAGGRCGMCGLRDDQVRDKVRTNLNTSADHIAFLGFQELEQSVRDDVAWLKAQDLIAPGAKDNIRGYIFHVHKDPKLRRLQRIDPPEEEEEEEK